MVGIALGFLGGYLYGSERVREEASHRLANAPEPVRRASERESEVVASVPLPEALKATASRATAGVKSVAVQATQAVTQAADAA
jgi:hypothetical protein